MSLVKRFYQLKFLGHFEEVNRFALLWRFNFDLPKSYNISNMPSNIYDWFDCRTPFNSWPFYIFAYLDSKFVSKNLLKAPDQYESIVSAKSVQLLDSWSIQSSMLKRLILMLCWFPFQTRGSSTSLGLAWSYMWTFEMFSKPSKSTRHR